MTTIAVFGDSIAVGLGVQIAHSTYDAVVGRSSSAINSSMTLGAYDRAYISAGSNDPDNPALAVNLAAIRNKIICNDVTWIAPRNSKANAIVRQVAFQRGDKVRDFIAGPDGIHPKSYVTLAKSVLET